MACPNCTEDEYCSDACQEADEPCLHGDLETLAVHGSEPWASSLVRCLDCGAVLNHHYLGPS